MTHFVITANRLTGGDVVYRVEAGWSPRLADAVLSDSKEQAEARLAQIDTPADALRVVGPYVMKVEVEGANVTPLGQREMIRAKGPSVHPQFAKIFSGESYVQV